MKTRVSTFATLVLVALIPLTVAAADCPQLGRFQVAFPNRTDDAAEMKSRATLTRNPPEVPPLVRLVLASVALPSAPSHNTDPRRITP
jgi:hypothetical protein